MKQKKKSLNVGTVGIDNYLPKIGCSSKESTMNQSLEFSSAMGEIKALQEARKSNKVSGNQFLHNLRSINQQL